MIHVAVAIIESDRGEVLISKRHDHLHQGGLWEYPGGKVESGESVQDALAREIKEELDVVIEASRPLIRIPHDYGDKRVLLDVWRVTGWSGEPQGREGQPWRWVPPVSLNDYDFPAANASITRAVQLPEVYVISPEPADAQMFLATIERLVQHKTPLLQLRAKSLSSDALRTLACEASNLCRDTATALLVNSDIQLARELNIGVHLTSRQVQELAERPLPCGQWVAASCHTAGDLEKAAELGADFVVLSPVNPTPSHPDASPIGWAMFHKLCERAVMPVYALGGMTRMDIERAQSCGGQGVAGIGSFWSDT